MSWLEPGIYLIEFDTGEKRWETIASFMFKSDGTPIVLITEGGVNIIWARILTFEKP